MFKGFVRVSTGIPGLDDLTNGGFIKGTTCLVVGETGTGKTLLGIQYIYNGLKNGERCMIVSLEETVESLIADVKNFNWDLEKYINEGKLFMLHKDPFELTDIVGLLVKEIDDKKISRLLIDSISVLGVYFKDPFEIRKQIYKLVSTLNSLGCTTLIIGEIIDNKLSRFGVEEFVADTVIKLSRNDVEIAPYLLKIIKMRRSAHSRATHKFEISDKGIKIVS